VSSFENTGLSRQIDVSQKTQILRGEIRRNSRMLETPPQFGPITQMSQQFCSGEWTGFYIENHRPELGWMHLFLVFEQGRISGEGTDYVGPWAATGSYDPRTGECRWTKKYVGRHQVLYLGNSTENGIQGKWDLSWSSGPFHIWPRRLGHLTERYLRE
jgi:hypothetical protein